MFEIAKFLWNLASAAAAVIVIIVSGFMLLVMGFTGKAAMKIKVAYIEAFNVMAARK